jgi:hypothetical protein
VPLLGALGAVGVGTGAIAIGMVATCISTTITISIVTTILTATSIAKAATGNIIRNTAGTHLTGTGRRRTSLAVRVRVELAVVVELAELAVRVAQEALEALAELAVQEALEALAGLAVQAAQVELAVPVDLVVRVALAKLEQGPAAVALERDPVVAELGPVQVVVGPEHEQVEAQRRTRSATAAHHHGQVPVPRVEDLRAVVETTREPAATEVEKAWAAADIVVAEAAVVVAADAEAAG